MSKLFHSIAAFSVLLLASVGANAADLKMPVKAPPPPPLPPPFSWTGCYVGGNAGGIWTRNDFSVAADTFAGQVDGSVDVSGGVAGVQVGCNYQTYNWVFGIQGDWDWTNVSGSINDAVFVGVTDSVKIKSLASATGRIGYAWDRFLLYAKGGGAWETVDFTSAGTSISTISDTRSGWTVGGGGEYAFTDWLTGFVEYDFYDFGTRSVTLNPFSGVVTFNVQETQSVAKAGLNIKFGGWGAPAAPAVRTKY
jgi:outer membrane immunogenic protein